MAKAFRDVRAEGKNPPREQPGNAAVIRAALTSDTARSQAARQANQLLPAATAPDWEQFHPPWNPEFTAWKPTGRNG